MNSLYGVGCLSSFTPLCHFNRVKRVEKSLLKTPFLQEILTTPLTFVRSAKNDKRVGIKKTPKRVILNINSKVVALNKKRQRVSFVCKP